MTGAVTVDAAQLREEVKGKYRGVAAAPNANRPEALALPASIDSLARVLGEASA